MRTDGRRPAFVAADDDVDEADRVSTIVRDLVQRHGPREIAVLARTNEQLTALNAALDRAGVPVVRSLGASPLERAITEAARSRTRDQLAAWAEGVWAGDASDPMRRRVAEEADRFLSSNESGGFRAWIEARQPFDDLEPDDDGAVSLLTFHAAKGREWSAVVVTGVEQGLVPHVSALTVAQRTEEARLLYVALTRASDELTVTWALRRNDSASGPSPWIEALRERGSVRTRRQGARRPSRSSATGRSVARTARLAGRRGPSRRHRRPRRVLGSGAALTAGRTARRRRRTGRASGRQRLGRRAVGAQAAQP